MFERILCTAHSLHRTRLAIFHVEVSIKSKLDRTCVSNPIIAVPSICFAVLNLVVMLRVQQPHREEKGMRRGRMCMGVRLLRITESCASAVGTMQPLSAIGCGYIAHSKWMVPAPCGARNPCTKVDLFKPEKRTLVSVVDLLILSIRSGQP